MPLFQLNTPPQGLNPNKYVSHIIPYTEDWIVKKPVSDRAAEWAYTQKNAHLRWMSLCVITQSNPNCNPKYIDSQSGQLPVFLCCQLPYLYGLFIFFLKYFLKIGLTPERGNSWFLM